MYITFTHEVIPARVILYNKLMKKFLRPDEHFTFFNLHILFCANGGGGV